MEVIAWIGFSQSLFAAILMIAKRDAHVSDKILAAWLSLLAIEFLTCGIDYEVIGAPILSSSFLLINPAFYLYVRSLIKPGFSLHWSQLLHLAPFIIFEVISYMVYKPFSLEAFFSYRFTHWYGYVFSAATVASWFFYNTASTRMLHIFRKGLTNEFSTIESNRKLSWVFFIVVFYNLYCLLVIISALIVLIFKVNFLLPHIVNYSALLALVYILGFYGLRQLRIYRQPVQEELSEEKYRNSLLSDEKKKSIRALLFKYFDEKKPFLNPELNLSLLSQNLGIPKHHLTEVLNMEIGRNFYSFVNEYRVEEVKKMLADPANKFSIEAIGYECGFSSKSTFFTVFRKFTGVTPDQYRNSLIRVS